MKHLSTIIVGGGLAGLAAASVLSERGVLVTLFESRPRLGGRAGSFIDRTTGQCIDNCQHVSMGCCTNFEHMFNSVGLSRYLRKESVLHFIGTDGVVNRLSAGRLPAPFHLWNAFRHLSFLSRRDLRGVVRGLWALVRVESAGAAPQSFEDWLREHRQTPAAIELFWHVVLVSALSESLDRIDVFEARKVFVDAFLRNRTGWEVRIPTVPLDQLYGTHLADWLTSRGASIRLQSGVAQILIDGNTAVAVQLRNGERHSADSLVVAVPHDRVLSLLPESLQGDPQLSQIAQLESAPISSVHLWFDRSPIDLPHAVLIDRMSQWVFNRSELGRRRSEDAQPRSTRRSDEDDLHYYQVVISASRNLEGRPQSEVIEDVVGELTNVWPETANVRLVHSRLVTEHRAVLSVRPGSGQYRPVQQSPIPNLQIAGDWTHTGWPGTMESAVRSGYLAAENILAHLGRPQKLVQPDLPTSLLSKVLLGL